MAGHKSAADVHTDRRSVGARVARQFLLLALFFCGHRVLAQRSDIECVKNNTTLRLISPDPPISADDFFRVVKEDSSMTMALRNLQQMEHNFYGYFGLGKSMRRDHRHRIEWIGHALKVADTMVVAVDSSKRSGCMNKLPRKRPRVIEYWALERLGHYTWPSEDMQYPVARSAFLKDDHVVHSLALIERCIDGLWPNARNKEGIRFFGLLDSAVCSQFRFTITDETGIGDRVIPCCFRTNRSGEYDKKKPQMPSTRICFDRELRHLVSAIGNYSSGRTDLTVIVRSAIVDGVMVPEVLVVLGTIPISRWRREHFVLTLSFNT